MSGNQPFPERDAVARLYELSRSGEVENSEFSQLAHLVYERMFETYNGASEFAAGESIS